MLAADVSVVIPCFNAARHIAAATESVLTQTSPPREIIIVDDGSSDASAEIVTSLARKTQLPIRLNRQANAGVSVARNIGVGLAKGSVIAFLDADDRWPENSLAIRLGSLNPEIELVFGRVAIVVEQQGRLAATGLQGPGRLAGSMLVRRTAFDRVGGFDPARRSAETIGWVARAVDLNVAMAEVEHVVLWRIVHGGNMMLAEGGHVADRLQVLRETARRRRSVTA